MNKIERMQAVFCGKMPDRVPVGFWHHFSETDPIDLRIQQHIQLYREADPDILKVMDDCFAAPMLCEAHVEKASDWQYVVVPGRESIHYRNASELMRGVAAQTKDEVMCFATVWSPFKLMSWVPKGGEMELMEHCKEDPQAVLNTARKVADSLADWVRGYMETGISGIFFSCQFSEPGRFTQEEWETFVMPFDRIVLDVMKDYPDKYTIIHICGEPSYDYRVSIDRYKDYPGNLFNWAVNRENPSLEEGRAIFGRPVMGGFDNHSGVLIDGPTTEIEKKVKEIIARTGKQGIVLGADCTVPPSINRNNLRAVVEATKNCKE